jgi:hypothetical protein
VFGRDQLVVKSAGFDVHCPRVLVLLLSLTMFEYARPSLITSKNSAKDRLLQLQKQTSRGLSKSPLRSTHKGIFLGSLGVRHPQPELMP